MSGQIISAHLMRFIRDDRAGVSLEYTLIMISMCAVVTPSFYHYTETIKKLFAFVGSLIR